MEHGLFVWVDLLGTFAFAISGALAAEQKRLDLFGVFAISYLTACGGGIIRDVCLGSVPPVGIADWRYPTVSLAVSALIVWARPLIDRIQHPVIFFDALGLGFFAVFGAYKALKLSGDVETAVTLGVITAVGGGALRDIALNRVPIIMRREIYALAALVGAAIQVLGQSMQWSMALIPWLAVATCLMIRLLALRYSWSLPIIGRRRS